MFRSALPRRERLGSCRSGSSVTPFRSALPRRERRHDAGADEADGAVSIRAPAQGATRVEAEGVVIFSVSIRAPAQGATAQPGVGNCVGVVSIRAPAQGATRLSGSCRIPRRRFDPRSRAGSDVAAHPLDLLPPVVSIRAPAQGATASKSLRSMSEPMFRSALPRRERQPPSCSIRPICSFRSALPRRERRCSHRLPVGLSERFDPRSRAGSDRASPPVRSSTWLFRSALPRRERPGGGRRGCGSRPVSIRAPAQGATPTLVVT